MKVETRWRYGDSWEKYPIKPNEIWEEKNTGSKLQVIDIFDGLPEFMKVCDMLYIDPPWNKGNISSFYSKAGLQPRGNFNDFISILFQHIKSISPRTCYMEMGKQNIKLVEEKMKECFPAVQKWEITYYRKNPCFLIRGSDSPTLEDFTYEDDMKTPLHAIKSEKNCETVGDLCSGRGLIPLSAFKSGKKFMGTELNPRRMACTIEKITKLGGLFIVEDLS